MKKSMFVLACAAAMAAAADIVSANVVGFVDHTVATSTKMMKGQNFQAVTGSSIDLQALTPMKGNEVCEATEFNLWWWNTDETWGDKKLGNKYATWNEYYYDPTDPEAEDGYVFTSCWTDMDEDEPMKYAGDYAKTFAAGDGFFVQPACANPKLVCSGEVLGTSDTTNEYRKVQYTTSQKQLVVSPFPVAVALQDIVPMKGTELCEATEFNLWWWNSDETWGDKKMGNKKATWNEYYYDPTDPEAEEGYVFESCWTDMDEDEPMKYTGDYAKTFAVGEGFYIQPACANPFLAFPNPFYVAK